MPLNGIPRGEPILVAVTQPCLDTINTELIAVTQVCYPTQQIQSFLQESFCSRNCTDTNQSFLDSVKSATECQKAPDLDSKWISFQKDRAQYCQIHAKNSDGARFTSHAVKKSFYIISLLIHSFLI
jgi:hypothetical protein